MTQIANCPKCGREMRLGGMRTRVGRKHGVWHYLDHVRPYGCDAAENFTSVMLKPYPARDEDKPWFQMIQRWNEAAGNAAKAEIE